MKVRKRLKTIQKRSYLINRIPGRVLSKIKLKFDNAMFKVQIIKMENK